MSHLVVLLSCEDQPGIVYQLTDTLLKLNANIIDADQHTTDETPHRFYIRVEFTLESFSDEDLYRHLMPLKEQLSATITWHDLAKPLRCALLVSKDDHCLHELLYQWKSQELAIDITGIISNHDLYQEIADWYKVPFHYVPSQPKAESESEILKLADQTDCLVLARYMQILSPNFLKSYHKPIINIHHSFLPSFIGAKPYHQAYKRGVKLIGATAHFATEDLDQGPILVQNTTPISHRHSVDDLIKKGKALEKQTLTEAVHLISEHRVISYRNKTIIF